MQKSNFVFDTPTKTRYVSQRTGETYFQDVLRKTCTCKHGSLFIKQIAEGAKEPCYHLKEILQFLKGITA